MKRLVLISLVIIGLVISATRLHVRAQGRGANNADANAARQRQLALEADTPKLQITEEHLTLNVPGHTIGETVGVSKNSKGHLFVYSRTGNGGSARRFELPGKIVWGFSHHFHPGFQLMNLEQYLI